MWAKHKQNSGFTIVELLIVVVVIAILAAITIVSYSGISQRAKNSANQTLAATISRKAEAHNAIKSSYPTTLAAFATVNEAKVDNMSVFVTAGTGDPGDNQVIYQFCDSGNGYKVWYLRGTSTALLSGGTTSVCTTPTS